MNGLQIYLADGTYNGAIVMTSSVSKFNAVRVKRSDVSGYNSELGGPGIYLLLVGTDSVYVGQTGFDTINSRIFKPHSGNIDSSWHTVVGFKCTDPNISKNELEYIENGMCEYVHSSYNKCLTISPAKSKCNAQFRSQHYHLSIGQMHSCNQYIDDLKYYISILPKGIFPPPYQPATNSSNNKELFYFKNPSRDVDGKAEILIHTGNTGPRTAVLKAGSKVSIDVSPNFGGSNKVIQQRATLTAQGILVARILQTDITFSSQSGAGQFLNGTSFNGNVNWKTVNGDILLKNLLQ